MTVAGRGAQVILGGDAQLAARGGYSSNMETNALRKRNLELAGTWPDGSTPDGTTLTGANPPDEVIATPEGTLTPPLTASSVATALSVTNTITAHAGGTQAAATTLTASINRITVCATDADSVRLPAMAAGQMVVVINSSANSLQVFGASTATINGVATGTGVALAAGKVGIYFAVTASLLYGGALA